MFPPYIFWKKICSPCYNQVWFLPNRRNIGCYSVVYNNNNRWIAHALLSWLVSECSAQPISMPISPCVLHVYYTSWWGCVFGCHVHHMMGAGPRLTEVITDVTSLGGWQSGAGYIVWHDWLSWVWIDSYSVYTAHPKENSLWWVKCGIYLLMFMYIVYLLVAPVCLNNVFNGFIFPN